MIVMAGTIGAGKTSLTDLLADHLGAKAFYESVDNNPILPLFYKDPKKYAFLLQVYFLNSRLDQIMAAQKEEQSIIDRSIFEDALLFKLNADLGRATHTEVAIYKDLVDNVLEEVDEENQLKTPDLLIHVRVSLETMLKRIAKRGRPYEQVEQDPDLYQYYKDLNERYEEWIGQYDRSPKLIINGDELNFVEDAAAREQVLKMIDEKLAEVKAS
ncbi:deoxynucleoside kinase [Fructobacillus parabroussonetiae]|uniref:Deoxynucleoside kinase n=1 Tax=Fructobacillus parabroussonetiae TaxID=2713174 RepID=A0ABS5QV93_9LACO|nr:deoxynucleoside kinase [Fructobacillus parabroussonetiae]MBS9337119.1 deoxynucleoside kinase [Fructobacillus parabroussonetiae]MCK8617913.1 deoxynucleoside kinase [Fructobacillus parabroussonetiae]